MTTPTVQNPELWVLKLSGLYCERGWARRNSHQVEERASKLGIESSVAGVLHPASFAPFAEKVRLHATTHIVALYTKCSSVASNGLDFLRILVT